MKKFKRNKKVFIVRGENIAMGRIVDRNVGGFVRVKLTDGEIEDYMPVDIFSWRKDAEREAERVREEHEALMNEACEEYAQAYYADVMEQLPSLI